MNNFLNLSTWYNHIKGYNDIEDVNDIKYSLTKVENCEQKQFILQLGNHT